jgi:hypothetical protein
LISGAVIVVQWRHQAVIDALRGDGPLEHLVSGRCQDDVDAAPVPNHKTGLDHTVDRACDAAWPVSMSTSVTWAMSAGMVG